MACNYDPSATDPGTCDYAEEFYDCDGNCIADIDCAGECGGSNYIDDCGYCVSEDTPADDCLSAENIIPDQIYLKQNYPNPFNPSTTIQYEVPLGITSLNLSLFDMNGRLIKTFHNGVHAPGYFTITLTSENLKSGIYILKLSSDKTTSTKKITVLK